MPASATYSVEKSEAVQALRAKKIGVVEALNRLSTEEYFTYLNELLAKNPGTEADKPALEQFARIGIKSGEKFTINSFDAATQEALRSLPNSILGSFDLVRTTLRDQKVDKPDGTIAHYGTNYQKRAAIAYFGLGALGPEDAVYLDYNTDEDKQPLHGDASYGIHFEPKKTPPARAFWSITLYDKDGYLTENSIRRYAIGDRDKLAFNKDGSLDIYVQHDNPGKDREANWLPAPKEFFNLSVRLYWVTDDYLNKEGVWEKPPIKKVAIPKP